VLVVVEDVVVDDWVLAAFASPMATPAISHAPATTDADRHARVRIEVLLLPDVSKLPNQRITFLDESHSVLIMRPKGVL